MTWASNLAKFVVGVVLAIAILLGGSIALALYFMYKVTTPPPKPIFANEIKAKQAQSSPVPKSTKPAPSPTTQTSAKPKASETPTPEPLEPGAYKARVTWEQGLILRAEPNLDAARTGGLAHNQQIVVLEESADKNWQRVRLEDSEQEGWVKAGNTERIQEE